MSSRPPSSSPFGRPPLGRNESSSPSLFGMERSIPDFQDFVKRLPPADATKPLPPVPLVPRRASSDWPPQSRSPSTYGSERGRRASSVYSRTASMWRGDAVSFSSADFADEPMPPLPTLQPLAYSLSTPQLGEALVKDDLNDARICRPLIGTPSPTVSRGRTPSTSRRASGPVPNGSPAATKKQLQTVSLEQAKRNLHAAGAIHLLPEELRAKTIKKRRSDGPLRMDSVDMFSPIVPTHPREPSTLIDHQGRHRSIAGPFQTSTGQGQSSALASKLPYHANSKVGAGPERHMDSHNLNETHERGRARERTGRPAGPYKRTSDGKKSMSSANGSSAAIQYRNLVSNAHDSRSPSSGYHDTDSDDSIKTRMKLVPHPLFRTKPPAKLPGAMTGYGYGNQAPQGPQDSRRGPRDSRGTSKSSRGSFPFGLSLSPPSSHRRRSTSGSIPISPPMDVTVDSQVKTDERRGGSPFRRPSDIVRESAYYPYVGPRKKTTSPTAIPLLPPLLVPTPSDDSVSGRLSAHDRRGDSWSTRTNSLRRTESLDTRSKTSDSATSARHLLTRAARSAAKYVDRLTPTPSPPSPTYPSPVSHHPDHLGWSTKAKHAFDEARSSLHALSPTSTPRTPRYEHISLPARPLDETRLGLRESGGSSPRSSSLFGRRKVSFLGGVLEGWGEGRKERRREVLKRGIRVVPGSSMHTAGGGRDRGAGREGWM